MAADFIQKRQEINLSYPTNSGMDSDPKKIAEVSNPPTPRYFCGELVKSGAFPGVNPNVLVSKTRVWRDGKEMITEVNGLFPDGVVSSITPSTSNVDTMGIKSRLWKTACSITMLTFGMGAKLILRGMNTTIVHGQENLNAVWYREPGRPLLSVINHNSCFDDPGIWGAVLSPMQLFDSIKMRWGAAASEVLFSNMPLSTFYSLGKVVPIVRGWGVYQPAMEFLLERLNGGGWVNIFPEARVNVDGRHIRYKWGVGRLLWDCSKSPLILPVVHMGMSNVLPNPGVGEKQSAIVRPGNLVTVNIGHPIDLSKLLNRLKKANVDNEEARRCVTEEIQKIMNELHDETKKLHYKNIIKWTSRWHDKFDLTPSILT